MTVKEFSSKRKLKWNYALSGLIGIFFLTMVLALSIGSVHIRFFLIFKILLSKIISIPQTWPESFETILLYVRLPRILLATLIGAALGISGCTMQGLFRNPMASPYVTGIASSAAFGASLIIILKIGSFWITPSAFLFSMTTVFLLYSLVRVKKNTPVETLLLAGIAISLFFTALVSFTQYIAPETQLRQIIFWIMGGLSGSNWNKVVGCLPCILLGSIGIFFFNRELNIMLIGEETAQNTGVNVKNTRKILLILVSLITSSAVAVTGIIGFIGLIIPHIMRILVGPNHRILLPCSFLGGAIFLIWADILARTLISPTELPVGIITAILGVPFFLFLLHKRIQIMKF